MKRLGLSTLFLLTLATAAAAAPRPAARALEAGQQALAAGDLPRALGMLERAYQLGPAPELLYLLGQVARAQGRVLAAADLWRRYLEEAPLVPAERRAEIEGLLGRSREPSAEVTVSGAGGAALWVDDRLAGVLPLSRPLLVPAGLVRFRLELRKRRVTTQAVLPAHRLAELRVTFIPPATLLTLTPAVLPVLRGAPAPELLARAAAAARDEQAVLLEAPGAVCLGEDARRCLLSLAESRQAQYVLVFDAERSQTRVELLDVAARSAVAAVPLEPQDAAQGALRKLLREGLTRPQGTLQVVTEPAGAEVLLDGWPLGTTPLERPAFTGAHSLLLVPAGRPPLTQRVTIEEGQLSQVRVVLPPGPVPTPVAARPALRPAPTPSPPRVPAPRRRLRGVGLSLLGVGVTAGVGAGVSAALDGYQSCSERAQGAQCRFEFDGRRAALGLGISGGLVVIGGGVLLILDLGRR